MDAVQVAFDYWIVPLALERLPMVAAHLLADGYDSPALREIAGLSTGDVAVLREVFVEALRQLGVYVDGLREAPAGLPMGQAPWKELCRGQNW